MTQQNFRADSFVEGLAIKAPVRVTTTAPVTLAGEQTIGLVPLTAGDRILVKDQANPVENGIYNVESSNWQRAGDCDGERDLVGGTLVPVYDPPNLDIVLYRLTGEPTPLSPGVDSLTFTLFYDPNAAGGATLPISTGLHNTLRADGAGGWTENATVQMTLAGEVFADYEDAANYILMGPGTADNRRISTRGGAMELIADNGLAGIVVFGGSNLSVIQGGTFYMEEVSDHNVVLVGQGQFWVRDTDGAPMFTDRSSVDYVLNAAPTFSPPLVLLDTEEIQFGTGTDVTVDFDGSTLRWQAAAANTPFDIQDAMILRIRNALGTGYIDIQNNGVLSLNNLLMTSTGGTSGIDYQVGAWDHNDNRLLRPVLDDYGIQDVVDGSTSGAVTFDFEDGNSHYIALTENITSVTLDNPPVSGRLGQIEIEILQDSTARTVTWPGSVSWNGGTAPDLSTTNGRYLVHLRTRDGGTSYLGTWAGPFT